ncbi:MAG: rhodanese-like domain-containing protein [Coriobacteriales bacterium]|nr:rhodanese-like domain-containing protein [Coriobacteriales bacterium]
MKPKHVVWIAVAAVAAIVLFALLRPTGGGGIVTVDSAGVDKAREAGAQIIDVREPAEFQMGRIPGAVNVPVGTIETAAKNWDRNATYVVYCATGARSQTAVDAMKAMGFTNIKHFSQGIQAYTGQVDSSEQTSQQPTVQTDGKPVFIEFYTPT